MYDVLVVVVTTYTRLEEAVRGRVRVERRGRLTLDGFVVGRVARTVGRGGGGVGAEWEPS